MRIHNADGGEVESCGNAARCVAWLLFAEKKHARGHHRHQGRPARVQRRGRRSRDRRHGRAPVRLARNPMAQAVDTLSFALDVPGFDEAALANVAALSMGNPHVRAVRAPKRSRRRLRCWVPPSKRIPGFPRAPMWSFAQVKNPRERSCLRVWERGVGETLACGTGACAAAVAAAARGLAERKVAVTLKGGTLSIEQRDDGHVLMTGPTALAFSGEVDVGKLLLPRSRGRCLANARRRGEQVTEYAVPPPRPATQCVAGHSPASGGRNSVSVVTFGCRLNAYESEAIRARAAEAGLDGRRHRQHLRGHRRGGAPVAPDDPQIAPRASGRTADRHRLRGANRARHLCRDGRGRSGDRQRREARRASYAPDFLAGAERVRVADIMEARETAAHSSDSFDGRARAVLMVQNGCDHRCTFCIIPYGRGNSRSVGVGAVIEEARASGRGRLPRDRAVGRGSHRLWRGSAGAADAGRAGARDSRARAGAFAAAALLDRFHRGGRRPDARHRRGRAADAAFPSVGAVGRRHDPEADEAASSRARHHRVLRNGAAPAARRRLRRRPDRGVSHRNRDDVRKHAARWSTKRGFRICTCFRSVRAPARPPRACRSFRAPSSRNARRACGQGAMPRWPRISRVLWAREQDILVEKSDVEGRTPCFARVEIRRARGSARRHRARAHPLARRHERALEAATRASGDAA